MNNTAMPDQIKASGITVPSNAERIWNYLKDKPAMPASAIAETLGIPIGSVWSQVHLMCTRGQLESRQDFGVKGRKLPLVYTAIGEEYTTNRRVVPKVINITKPPIYEIKPPIIGAFNPATFLGDLTLNQLVACRAYINKMLK